MCRWRGIIESDEQCLIQLIDHKAARSLTILTRLYLEASPVSAWNLSRSIHCLSLMPLHTASSLLIFWLSRSHLLFFHAYFIPKNRSCRIGWIVEWDGYQLPGQALLTVPLTHFRGDSGSPDLLKGIWGFASEFEFSSWGRNFVRLLFYLEHSPDCVSYFIRASFFIS